MFLTMTTFENAISPDQRFAKRNNTEYHVFSSHIEDASTIEKWVGITQPKNVLIDPETYELLRNKRIEWMFNADNTLISVNIKHDEGKVEYVGEIKGE